MLFLRTIETTDQQYQSKKHMSTPDRHYIEKNTTNILFLVMWEEPYTQQSRGKEGKKKKVSRVREMLVRKYVYLWLLRVKMVKNESQVSLECCWVCRHPLVSGKLQLCFETEHSPGNLTAQTSFSSCSHWQHCNKVSQSISNDQL